MFVTGKCTKCKKTGALDIGDHDIKEAQKLLSEMSFGECGFGGYHVELGKMTEYIEVDWENTYNTKEEALKAAENKEG